MSAEIIPIHIDVDGKEADTAVGSIRKQIKEANQELINAQRNFGAMSDEAVAAAKKVAELTDEMGDARSLVEAFNPDQKFKAFGQAIQGVAGAFAGMQGAMALVGVESKDVEAQLLKVQGALALSEGLNTVLDSVQGFKNLGSVIKTYVVGAFNTLRAAIGGTGIGLLVIGIAALVMNFDKLKKYVTDTFPALNDSTQLFNDLKQAAVGIGNAIMQFIVAPLKIAAKTLTLDFKGAVKEIKNQYDVVGNYQKGANSERLRQDKSAAQQRLEAQIKSNEDFVKLEKAKGKDVLSYEIQTARLKQQLYKDDNEKLKEAKLEEKLLYAGNDKERADAAKQAADKADAERKARQDKANAELQQHLDKAKEIEQQSAEERYTLGMSAEDKEQYALTNKFAERIAAYDKVGKDTTTLVESYGQQSAAIYDKHRQEEADKQKAQAEKDAAEEKQRKDQAATAAQEAFTTKLADREFQFEVDKTDALTQKAFYEQLDAEILANKDLTEQQKTELQRKNVHARMQIDKLEADNKKKIVGEVANVLNAGAAAAGESTVLGKGLAIAAATISTYQSAQLAYNSAFLPVPTIASPILGGLAAGAAVAVGIGNIKKIASVKVPGKGGGGGSAPSISAPTPTSLATTSISNTQAPMSTTTAAGANNGTNEMLGGVTQTQQQLAAGVERLNNHLDNGIQASVSETERAAVANQMRTIQGGTQL